MAGAAGAGATGGAAGSEPGALPADPGSPPPAEPVPRDTSRITFDWPEAEAGMAATCRAGRYAGTFVGTYTTGGSFPVPFEVAGNIEIFLAETQQGEFFEVRDGQLSGLANNTVPFSATIVGELDCERNHFEAMLLDGRYDFLGSEGNFEGPIVAGYDRASAALVNGIWNVSEGGTHRGGGSWGAAWQP